MSFTSITFIIFFAGLFAVYWLMRRSRWQNLFLLAASFFFYAWVSPWYAVLLAATTAADFYLALGMVRWQNRRKTFLVFSLIMNLGMLGFFKYFNFFSASAAAVLQGIGLVVEPAVLNLALPLGISFYTLKKLSYILDVYSGVMQPVRSLVDYELYVAFFPQVISGPIDRPRQLLPQIQSERRWLPGNFNAAWPLLVMGLFKKLVVADTIKIMVDKIFILTLPGKLLLLCGGLAFTLQVLADFSAYTDISRGLAYLLGFKTSENFRRPYLSLTPTDFWNRWHITLSSWLRDYIFFPHPARPAGTGFCLGIRCCPDPAAHPHHAGQRPLARCGVDLHPVGIVLRCADRCVPAPGYGRCLETEKQTALAAGLGGDVHLDRAGLDSFPLSIGCLAGQRFDQCTAADVSWEAVAVLVVMSSVIFYGLLMLLRVCWSFCRNAGAGWNPSTWRQPW